MEMGGEESFYLELKQLSLLVEKIWMEVRGRSLFSRLG